MLVKKMNEQFKLILQPDEDLKIKLIKRQETFPI